MSAWMTHCGASGEVTLLAD